MCSRTWRDFAENTASRPGSSPACSRVSACCPSGSRYWGVDEPWIGAFCRKVMELNFVRDQNINQPEQMNPIVAELGLSGGNATGFVQFDYSLSVTNTANGASLRAPLIF